MEIRQLLIEVEPPSATGRGVGEVMVTVHFSDGTFKRVKTLTTIKNWPSEDLLNTVKVFVRDLESGPGETE
jgi:hypothetical protein